jgi:L-malate glycosyltransferase
MRIVLVMAMGSPWARDTASWLSRFGHTVHVVDFVEKHSSDAYLYMQDHCRPAAVEAFMKSMASVHELNWWGPRRARYVLSAGALRRIANDCQADVVLSLYCGGMALMAHLSGFRPHATYAVGSDVLKIRGLTRWVSRRVLSAADAVFCNGRYLAEQTRRLAPRANVVPLLLGVDATVFTPGSPPALPVHIVCTRGFLPYYNNRYLVEGLAALPEGLPDFRVTFVSPGPTLPYVRSLADKMLSPDMRRRVEFLGGVFRAQLPSLLQSSHVYVSLARSDGTSTAVLEALASGLYPVLSDIPQNREWIDQASPNGLLVPLDQPQKLADALAFAIRREDLRAQVVLRNRQMVLDRADSSQTMKTLSSMLEDIVKNHER